MSLFRITLLVELPDDMAGAQEGELAVYDLASAMELTANDWWSRQEEDEAELQMGEVKIEQQHVRWEELP
jgi:hypothetical protein